MSTIKDKYNETKPNSDQVSKRTIKRLGSMQLWGSIAATIFFIVGGVCAGIFIKETLTKWFIVAMCVIGLIVVWIFAIKEGRVIRKAAKA